MRRGDRHGPDSNQFSLYYGRRGGDGRRGLGSHYMQRDFPQNPRVAPRPTPGGPYGDLSPRNPGPRMDLMNRYQRMNQMNGQQGQAPLPPMDDVKKWVLETCGDNLEEVTGSMKIKDIPGDIAQFVVHKPTIKLQAAFKDRKRKNRYGSSLMFHGTPLPNLQPILQGGFKGGRDGAVWVAKEPLISLGYALKAAMWGGGARGAFLEGGGGRPEDWRMW
jgi:hypothetical protein